MLTRRAFTAGLTTSAFAGLALSGCARTVTGNGIAHGYGPLVADRAGLLDLPSGFSYRVISSFGDPMDDGLPVPDRADGMGAIPLDGRRVALVRNHELQPRHGDSGAFVRNIPEGLLAFDRDAEGRPLPGGTTTIVYDCKAGKVEAQYLSLAGTIRNCAGGTTPWGSWLTCEEDVSRAGPAVGKDHGWVFEVPAARRGLADPVPLKALGRFNHEAAAVDPRTGIVYLTEDRDDSLFYRLLPNRPGALHHGGRLQALAFREPGLADSRNLEGRAFPVRDWQDVTWIDLEEVESPQDDLRMRGHANGAALFARGEGIHYGDGDVYFACTSGGAAGYGQIMRYRPSRFEGHSAEAGAPARLQLFVESDSPTMLNYGDNLVVGPDGHLIVCEDQYTDVVENYLKGVAPDGRVYDLARLHVQTELAGACFSPDGRTLFVNVYSPGKTLAITGPWGAA